MEGELDDDAYGPEWTTYWMGRSFPSLVEMSQSREANLLLVYDGETALKS